MFNLDIILNTDFSFYFFSLYLTYFHYLKKHSIPDI